MEDNQITNIGYDVALSNIRMFKMKSFGSENKLDLTKINPNPLLGQGIIRRDIIFLVMIF